MPQETHSVDIERNEALRRKCNKAVSIGMDSIENAEVIYVTAKGKHKAEIIAEVFKDARRKQPKTTMGYLIKHHPKQLVFNLDREAARKIIA